MKGGLRRRGTENCPASKVQSEAQRAGSSWRQRRRLTSIELHVEGGEKRCRPSVIAHKGDEIDQSAAAELP